MTASKVVFCSLVMLSSTTMGQNSTSFIRDSQVVILGAGPYSGPAGYDHGMQTTMHCGNNPESWVRGSIEFTRDTGFADIKVELETDSVIAGPKGRLHIVLLSSDVAPGVNPMIAGGFGAPHVSKPIYTIDTDELSIGGKPPGKAVVMTGSSSVTVPLDVASKVKKITISAQCTGHETKIGGWVTLNELQGAFNSIGKAVAAQ